VAVETSDWDLLFVGEGRSLHTHELDMIWISPTLINSERWLGSELASHIAAYGRWLLGCEDWRHRVHISPSTVARKQALVQFQLMELDKVWPALLPGARTRHIRRLRREVQRLRLLASGTAVPPAQHLDATWMKYRSPPEELEALFAAAEDRSWAS
jgi:hypothetical protein